MSSHAGELHGDQLAGRLNRLRAGVLGANDGIVSVAGLVVGVAGATDDRMALLTAGSAGLVAGAFSMAGGEFVSVSSQRDTEKAQLALERWELDHMPGAELDELSDLYARKGLDPQLARAVAEQLTARDALAAHAEVELGINPDALTSPWAAARASFLAFVIGALLPLLAILLPPLGWRVPACVVAVVVALTATGLLSARWGSARWRPAVARNVGVGTLAMAVTYALGSLLGTSI